eukprot:6185142-Pleurochrysis_carterae.AAC.2
MRARSWACACVRVHRAGEHVRNACWRAAHRTLRPHTTPLRAESVRSSSGRRRRSPRRWRLPCGVGGGK